MSQLRTIIVDDEVRARSVIRQLLQNNHPNIEIVDECETLAKAVKSIKTHKPELVLLDIEMPDYAGYEIVNFFQSIEFEIIFITAFDEYAVRAFDISAVDYLVKPIDIERLRIAIEKAKHNLEKKHISEKYNELYKTLNTHKIIIPESGNRRVLDLCDIIAIKAEGAYTTIFTKNDTKIMISKNLKYFENLLSDYSYFYRVHRAWIINVNYLTGINKSNRTITLQNNLTANISRNSLRNLEKIIKA